MRKWKACLGVLYRAQAPPYIDEDFGWIIETKSAGTRTLLYKEFALLLDGAGSSIWAKISVWLDIIRSCGRWSQSVCCFRLFGVGPHKRYLLVF